MSNDKCRDILFYLHLTDGKTFTEMNKHFTWDNSLFAYYIGCLHRWHLVMLDERTRMYQISYAGKDALDLSIKMNQIPYVMN